MGVVSKHTTQLATGQQAPGSNCLCTTPEPSHQFQPNYGGQSVLRLMVGRAWDPLRTPNTQLAILSALTGIRVCGPQPSLMFPNLGGKLAEYVPWIIISRLHYSDKIPVTP